MLVLKRRATDRTQICNFLQNRSQSKDEGILATAHPRIQMQSQKLSTLDSLELKTEHKFTNLKELSSISE